MGKDQEANPAPPLRGAVYVDGFNLYYPIEHNSEPYLKWLDLWRLAERLCAPVKADLVRVVFCTAVPEDNEGKRRRHNAYISALVASGVEVLKGHHVYDSDLNKMSEKQSDINVALSLICDAEDDKFDIAYLISADSDQTATGVFFKSRHPGKSLISVAPPTKEPPHKLRPYALRSIALSFDDVEACLFQGTVQGKRGLIVRPPEYDPPAGWVHPDDRPKKLSTKKKGGDVPTPPPAASTPSTPAIPDDAAPPPSS